MAGLPRAHVQMVLGSVVLAFEQVCPERLDLLHKHFRKLCNVLVCATFRTSTSCCSSTLRIEALPFSLCYAPHTL